MTSIDISSVAPASRLTPGILAACGSPASDLSGGINALLQRDGIVRLGRGVYPCSPLTMTQRGVIEGEGLSTEIIGSADPGKWWLDNYGVHGCRLQNLCLRASVFADTLCLPSGAPLLDDPDGINCLRLAGCFSWQVLGVMFQGWNRAKSLEQNAGDSSFQRCYFGSNRLAIANATGQNYLEGCTFAGNLRSIVGVDYSALSVGQCTFSGDASKGFAYAHVSATKACEGYDFFGGCHFENARHVFLSETDTDGAWAQLNVSDSRINCDWRPDGAGDGSDLFSIGNTRQLNLNRLRLSSTGGHPAIVKTYSNTVLAASDVSCYGGDMDWQIGGPATLTRCDPSALSA